MYDLRKDVTEAYDQMYWILNNHREELITREVEFDKAFLLGMLASVLLIWPLTQMGLGFLLLLPPAPAAAYLLWSALSFRRMWKVHQATGGET
jgi:hypothetical protein